MGIDKDQTLSGASELRRHAEKRLRARTAAAHPPRSEDELKRLVHELEVHQIELEMQNTELRLAQEQLDLSRNKYSDLYDFSPIGYFTFDMHGLILEVNLTGARLLGTDRGLLINRPFAGFVPDEADRKIFSKFCEEAVQNRELRECEVWLQTKDGAVLNVQVHGIAKEDSRGKGGHIYAVISDITERRRIEDELQRTYEEMDKRIEERTRDLVKANQRLLGEIVERGKAEESLQKALSEVRELKTKLREENLYLREEINIAHSHKEIVGNSGPIKTVLKQIEQVAPTESTVLIQGETGTGKELVAHAIHNLSSRNGRLMIKVNCAALPPTLIESELFGREKGAFTGALSKQLGRFELADTSTIFLDEIDSLPPELQAKLLRVLESGEFERLGGPRTVKVDIRIIAASNRDLSEVVKGGGFREDLFYRLNVFQIIVPPLRERKEDILPLIWSFVQDFSMRMGKRIESIQQKDVEAMYNYAWPGNVRELRNITERAMIITTGSVLHPDIPKAAGVCRDEPVTLQEVERRHIINALNATGWRVSGRDGAAEILGINPKTLQSRMLRLGIQRNKTR